MADVFISYSKLDRGRVAPLVEQLRTSGFSVWWDVFLAPGELFGEVIDREINAAQIVLGFWSKYSIQSQWVLDEMELGRQLGKLVPIKIDNVMPPLGFRQIYTVDISEKMKLETSEDLGEVLQSLEPALSFTSRHESKKAQQITVAVLPLENLSRHSDHEFFADGISEELLNILGNIEGINVVARASTFSIREKPRDYRGLGATLGVSHFVTGSIRRSESRVRITFQLVETRTNLQITSKRFDRELIDIFHVQEEIAYTIAESLERQFAANSLVSRNKPDKAIAAYDLYFSGKEKLLRRTVHELGLALVDFESALNEDPDLVGGLIGSANAHLLLSNGASCYGQVPVVEARATAKTLLERATVLQPGSAELLATWGFYH